MRWMLCHSGQRVPRHTLWMRDMLTCFMVIGYGVLEKVWFPCIHGPPMPLGCMVAPTPPGLISTLTLLQCPARPTWGLLHASWPLPGSSRRCLRDFPPPCFLWWLKCSPAPSSQHPAPQRVPSDSLCCLLHRSAPPGHCCSLPSQECLAVSV